MAASINKVILVGNLGQDPEIRTTQNGAEVANFSLATSETWKDKATGERREKTEWHRVVVFAEPLVRIIRDYVKKGAKIYIEGSLHTRKWTDNNGTERYTTEIVLQGYNAHLTILSNATQGENTTSNTSNNMNNNGLKDITLDELEDEIPF